MYDEKIMIFITKLQKEKVISFRLYNALYKITLSNQKFFIHQEGLEVVYTYSTLKELFENYVVYGASLINSLDDIKFD